MITKSHDQEKVRLFVMPDGMGELVMGFTQILLLVYLALFIIDIYAFIYIIYLAEHENKAINLKLRHK